MWCCVSFNNVPFGSSKSTSIGSYSACGRCGGPVNIKLKSKPNGTQTNSTNSNRVNSPNPINTPAPNSTPSSISSLISPEFKSLEPFLRTLSVETVHILPFAETLPSDQLHATESELMSSIITPSLRANRYLVENGSRLQLNSVDFKVVGIFPPVGVIDNSTIVRVIGRPLHALNIITKLHILPTKLSLTPELKLDSNDIFNDFLRPFFAVDGGGAHRHVAVGDTFVSRGVQFKVLACTPPDGVVDQSTEIFTDGTPLDDLEKIHLLPIYESLPNNEKNITSQTLFSKYLGPYFRGRFQNVSKGDKLEIDGVDFKVLAAEPQGTSGVVALTTEFFSEGAPIRAEDMKRQQEVDDELMARRLQQEDAQAAGIGPMGMGGMGGEFGVFPLRRPVQAVPSPAEMRQRLAALLVLMPPNDRNRVIMQRLHDALAAMQQGRQPPALDDGFLSLLRNVNGGGGPNTTGASRTAIESLPTRVFEVKSPPTNSTTGGTTATSTPAPDTSQDKAHLTCMICLMDYENGYVLRTLPCFHSFHAESCIDNWLMKSKLCPLCKNPVE